MRKARTPSSVVRLVFAGLLAAVAGFVRGESEFAGGFWKEFVYDRPNALPVIFGGESCSERAKTAEYCIYLDLWYDDGTPVWAQRADWSSGTHGWEKTVGAFVPARPIRKIRMHAFLRKGTGTARFRNLWLARREGTGDVVRVRRRWARPFLSGTEVTETQLQGRTLKPVRRLDPQETSPWPTNVPSAGFSVWTADAARKVTPLTFPDAAERAAAPSVALDIAARESESFQIQVTTGAAREWTDGHIRLPVLRDAAGRPFKGTFTWSRVGYLPRDPDSRVRAHPCGGADDRELWLPDPLLPPASFRVRKGSTQGLWLTVCAAADEAPGTYAGEIAVTEAGRDAARIRVAVRVRAFALPATFGLKTAFSVMDGFTRATYPDDFARMKRRTWDILLDHRLNPDDITRTEPPRIEDLVYARSRGLNSFNVLNLVPRPTDGKRLWTCWVSPEATSGEPFYRELRARLDPYVAELRRRGLAEFGYLYGFDERGREHYAGIDALWKRLRRDYPELPVMTTAKMYRDLAKGQTNIPHVLTTDWYCPITDDWDAATTARLQARGKQCWWYTCCGPGYPYANMASLEAPAVEGRLLVGWMTHLYRADGFLFWHVNFWEPGRSPLFDAGDVFFPDWKTYHAGLCPGDGVFLYPGKGDVYPSIRLALVRDGVEDYEWLQLAARRAGAAAVDAVSRTLVKSLTDFSRDPAAIRAARARLAQMIENPN